MNVPVHTFHDARLKSPLLRAINVAGAGLSIVGLRWPRLNAQAIVSAAQQQVGSHQKADSVTEEALQRYIDSAERDANLNALGRLAVHNMLAGALASRFSVLDWHQQNPSLSGVKIQQPWIILGLPRTGTSILSILLGLDPFTRPLLQWEARYPMPPPTLFDSAEDPRIAKLAKEYARLHKLNPAVATMHPFGSTLAEECTALFTYSLRTIGMETIAFTPTYGTWLDGADMTPAYAIHQQTLQALQQAKPTSQWVLKSPNHLWCLPTLLEAYPDARIVWTHRDPLQVIPSLASLNCAMQRQLTRRLDPHRVGSYWANRVQSALHNALRFDREQPADWCHHVQYDDLVTHPLATLQQLYAHFDLKMNELHRQRVATWLQQRPQHADGVHAYDIADFGWRENELKATYRTYREKYAMSD